MTVSHIASAAAAPPAGSLVSMSLPMALPRAASTAAPTMGTSTVLDPQTRPQDEGDEVFHYVRKDSIVESAVMGSVVTALCGAVFPVTKSPKPGSPVCAPCKEMMDMLRAFGPGGGDTPKG